MTFYEWNKNLEQWVNCTYSDELFITNTIECITFNVLFDAKEGIAYKNNIVYSRDRYIDTLTKLSEKMVDIITLNEVTNTFLGMVEECDWVRENYFISEITSNNENSSINDFGNLILAKIRPVDSKVFKVDTLPRPIVTGIFNVQNDKNNVVKFSVTSAHLTSLDKNFDKRQKQLISIKKELSKLSTDLNIIQGDMNFHSESENDCLELIGYDDVWSQFYDIRDNPGYTFDGKLNQMIQEIWYGFENRRMRLDRVLMTPNDMFSIKNIELIFNKPIYGTSKELEQMSLGKATILYFFDLLGITIFRNKEDYLFNSDHFGLITMFGIY